MPSNGDFLAEVGIIATILVSAYAAYWAFSIRHALAVGAYRRQALGIGLVALIFPLGFFIGTEPTPIGDFGLFWFLPLYAAFVTLLYWIDASALAARRSDPLLRDTLRWTKVRYLFWALNVAVIVLYISVSLYYQISGFNPSILSSPPLSSLLGVVTAIVITVEAFVPPILGALLLPVAASRSGDRALRGHLRWFGLFGLFAFMATYISAMSYPEHHSGIGLLTYLGLLVGGSFLYRSARSLAPLNRFPLDERS